MRHSDPTGPDQGQVNIIAAIAGTVGEADFLAVWLDVPAPTRVGRVARRRGDLSDATPEIALRQVEPARLGEGWRRIDASGAIAALAAVRRQLAPGRGDGDHTPHPAEPDGAP